MLNIFRNTFFLFLIIVALFLSYIFVPTIGKSHDDDKTTHDLQQISQESMGVVGEVSLSDFDPTQYLTTSNFNHLSPQEREKFYQETPLDDGTTLREYWITAEDTNIEIAPGVFFPAWTFNGQVPGPTLRATEGDRIKIYFKNDGTHPHTMHFHGYHTSEMDGAMTETFVLPGESFTYEFTAEPFGLHLYHCHSLPISQHIGKGLYGTYIVDPRNDTRPKADRELVMVMNGFDTNFDGENEVYGVNTVAFAYEHRPIEVMQGTLVRIYLVNILEIDQINSFHLHANFFDEYKTGTKLTPDTFTDTLIFGQGERSILDVRFQYPGMYMFHAHKTEFAEKGWSGFFEVLKP